MTDVPAEAFPTHGILKTREWGLSGPLALSEARRAWNRERIGLVSRLRCECTRPNCLDGVPAVRAADRFFVVEVRRRAVRPSPRKAS